MVRQEQAPVRTIVVVMRYRLASEPNRKGNFLTNSVKAVYFLDPRPANVDFDVNIYIAAALTWATGARTSEFAFTIVITPMRTASCSEKLRHLLFTFSTRRMA